MMTERLAGLSCVSDSARGNLRYVGDHIIRHYRPLGLAALLHDLHADPVDHLTIEGGIGTLTMYADGREDWRPTLPGASTKPHPQPRAADPELTAARRAVCGACSDWRDGKCSAAGCGCAGEGRPDVWSSRCPLGRWPTA